MNYLQTVLLSVVLASGIIVAMDTDSFAGWSTEDLKETIQRVAEDYRKEQWFNEQCYIWDTPVTLAQMLYWLGVAEWGFLPWSAWMRTNNPWSLHKEMWVKKAIWKHNIDNTKWRPEYATMYDGLYEKAHLIASSKFRYKCNYTFESAFAYTSWPNAERTDARKKNARNHINNALRWAMKFSNKQEAEVQTVETAPKENLRQKAKDQETRTQKLKDQLLQEEARTIEYRWDYIKSK